MAFLNNILVVVVVFVVVAVVFVSAAAAAVVVVVVVDLQQQYESFRNLAGNMLTEMSYLSLTYWTHHWVWYDMVF